MQISRSPLRHACWHAKGKARQHEMQNLRGVSGTFLLPAPEIFVACDILRLPEQTTEREVAVDKKREGLKFRWSCQLLGRHHVAPVSSMSLVPAASGPWTVIKATNRKNASNIHRYSDPEAVSATTAASMSSTLAPMLSFVASGMSMALRRREMVWIALALAVLVPASLAMQPLQSADACNCLRHNLCSAQTWFAECETLPGSSHKQS